MPVIAYRQRRHPSATDYQQQHPALAGLQTCPTHLPACAYLRLILDAASLTLGRLGAEAARRA
jgi:hypothetical protein